MVQGRKRVSRTVRERGQPNLSTGNLTHSLSKFNFMSENPPEMSHKYMLQEINRIMLQYCFYVSVKLRFPSVMSYNTTFLMCIPWFILQNNREAIQDLFDDFKDGTQLLSLLEVLSNQNLVS